MNILIKNAVLVDPVEGTERQEDILIQNERIAAIGTCLQADGAQVIDAAGCCAAPGLVDIHVHLREPGFEYKETIASGCAAAARGGVTSVACMPNTRPVIDTPELVRMVREKAACGIHVFPIAAVSVGQGGETLTDASALKAAGAPALSDDGVPVQSALLVRQALLAAGQLGMPVLSHCEDAGLVGNYAVNEGEISRKLGIPGRPAVAEELMAMRDAMLAEETGASVHICHVSTANTVEIVRQFKRRGVSITCETCPQYFTLTQEAILTHGAMARVNPPLRTERDRAAVLEGLRDGTIDAIVTDHAPHSAEEKARPLTEAPSGMVGLETSLALSLTALYHKGHMSLPAVIAAMTVKPAKILGLSKGTLQVGGSADLVLFNPDEEWVIDPARFVSKGRNTPFGGFKVKGKVNATIADGAMIYREG
ncbi:MAG: dihydroorotase [Oscillospiraceae bacterium]|nr:dihydroorotase [Oscillospiraceae bacterium]